VPTMLEKRSLMQNHLYQHKSHKARNGPLTQGSSSSKRSRSTR